ncbi:MAG: hypothetical protein JWL59_3546 [Chthoniobacteraceae bacterium]|nr:hypothetical protein [Chthoniobacteraceae bacterium]
MTAGIFLAIAFIWLCVLIRISTLIRNSRRKSHNDMRVYLQCQERSPSASLNARKYSRIVSSSPARRQRREEGL